MKKLIRDTFGFGLVLVFLITAFTGNSVYGAAKGGLSKAYRLINLRETSWDPKSVTALAWLGDTLVVAEFGGVSFMETNPRWEEAPQEPTIAGKIWLLTGTLTADGPEDVERTEILSDMWHPMGLYTENGEIYIHQKAGAATEILKATQNNGTWTTEVFASGWGQDEGRWWHSWPGGLIKRGDDFYFNFSSLPEKYAPGVGETTWPPVYKGSLIRLNANDVNDYEVVANGMRTNAAVYFGPFGSILGPDVQGDWKPDNQLIQIQPGGFYGHSANGAERPATNPPSVSMPQGSASNSPGDGHYLTSGPFAGQVLMGDQAYRGLNRYHLESINGHLQGTVIDFMGTENHNGMSDALADMQRAHPWAVEPTPDGTGIVFGCAGGWWVAGPTTGSIGLLVPSGETGFEVHAIRSIDAATMEIEFTRAINTAHATDEGRFEVNTWTNIPEAGYGAGSKQDNHNINPIMAALVSGTDNKVRLTFNDGALETGDVQTNGSLLEGIGYVLEFRLDVQATDGEELYDDIVFYTLNQIGPGITPVPGCTMAGDPNYNAAANDDDGSCAATGIRPQFNRGSLSRNIEISGSGFTVEVDNVKKFDIEITDVMGTHIYSEKNVQGIFKSGRGLQAGVYLVQIKTASGKFSDKVLLY